MSSQADPGVVNLIVRLPLCSLLLSLDQSPCSRVQRPLPVADKVNAALTAKQDTP